MQIVYMKKDGVPISTATIVMMVELISYQTVTFVLGATAFLWKFNFVNNKIAFIIPFLIFGVIVNLCMIAFFAVVLFSEPLAINIVNSLIKFLHKVKIIKNIEKAKDKATKQIDKYKEGITLLKSNPVLFIKVFLTTLVQLTAMYSVVFAVYKAFDQHQISYFNVFALQSLFAISMYSLPMPGAIGVSEGGFLKVFKYIFPQRLVAPAMLATRGLSFYLLLLAAGISVLITHVADSFRKA